MKKERVVYLLRINGKELNAEQAKYLKGVFGVDLKIIHRTLPPRNIFAYLNLIFCPIFCQKTVVAEIEAPLYVLVQLLRNRQKLAVKFIRPVFWQDENNVRRFSHYEEIISVTQEVFGEHIRIIFKTKPLNQTPG